MVLNKFFGKKKEEKYFLEIDTKTKPSPEVAVNEEDSTVETSITEGKETTVKTKSQPEVDVSYDAPEWVKAIKNYSNQSNSASAMEGENFAGKYVTNNVPQSRRRPGPSLATFKKMASKVNR